MCVRASFFIYTFSPNLHYSSFSTSNHLSDSTSFVSFSKSLSECLLCCFFFSPPPLLASVSCLQLYMLLKVLNRGRFPVGIVERVVQQNAARLYIYFLLAVMYSVRGLRVSTCVLRHFKEETQVACSRPPSSLPLPRCHPRLLSEWNLPPARRWPAPGHSRCFSGV